MDEQAARRCIREKNKQVALLALRKKKHHEQLLDETEGYLAKVRVHACQPIPLQS
ncbi:Charged multivesicular body protein 6 [Perkinsus olseni]|uniref:Charged multivesicular body protein 6 n=1 Tax=Perkinsus olseni TaxID=32597 RepID=A0A7J6TQN8_PEROL|nr:Charged multivesicular body protein 6 [Perkinsus olseni]